MTESTENDENPFGADSDPLDGFWDDPEFRAMVRDFVHALPERADAIRVAWIGGDDDALERLTHQLKGSGGMFGYPELTDAAARVVDGLRAGLDRPRIDRHAHDLLDSIARVVAAEVGTASESALDDPAPRSAHRLDR